MIIFKSVEKHVSDTLAVLEKKGIGVHDSVVDIIELKVWSPAPFVHAGQSTPQAWLTPTTALGHVMHDSQRSRSCPRSLTAASARSGSTR